MEQIRAVVAGAGGRMGQRIIVALDGVPGIELCGACERSGHASLGCDAGIPAGILFGIDPKAFASGNVLYPQLNSLYRDVLRYWAENGLSSQIGFFVESVLTRPANAALLLGSLFLGILGLAVRSKDPRTRYRIALVGSSTMVMFLTAFAPNPTWTPFPLPCRRQAPLPSQG